MYTLKNAQQLKQGLCGLMISEGSVYSHEYGMTKQLHVREAGGDALHTSAGPGRRELDQNLQGMPEFSHFSWLATHPEGSTTSQNIIDSS